MIAINKILPASLRRFLGNRNGMAASEFALLLPLMLLLLVGTVELGNALIADRKITAAVQTAADLVAQAEQVSTGDLNDIFKAVELILSPYAYTNAGISIYSVVSDTGGNLSVDWSESRGTGAPSATTVLPTNLLPPGSSVVVAAMNFRHQPIITGLLVSEFEISDRAFLRPRKSTSVTKVP